MLNKSSKKLFYYDGTNNISERTVKSVLSLTSL